MTLNEAKAFLAAKMIPYSELDFKDVAEFRKHISPFAELKGAADHPVKVLRISSNHQYKNIELQFIDENGDGNYTFLDLYFGQYFYELFDYEEEALAQTIQDEIDNIISNNISIVVTHDLANGKWVSDQIFDKREKDGFGLLGYEKTLERINGKRGLLSRLLNSKKQYEIYDWNTYQCVVK